MDFVGYLLAFPITKVATITSKDFVPIRDWVIVLGNFAPFEIIITLDNLINS